MPIFEFASRWFAIRQPRTPVSRALLVAQYAVLLRQAAMVYATVIIETLSISYVLPADLPWPLRFAAAFVFVPLGIFRLLQWYRKKLIEVDAETAHKVLLRARSRALWMGIISTAWALLLYQWVDDHTRILATLLIFVGSMGSAYCLASLPAVARLNLLVSTAPLALRLMVSGETFSVCFGINLLLLLGLFVRMMNMHYADFAMRVASRVRLTAQRERLRAARQAAVDEQNKQRDLAGRFDTAMNNMSQGLCFFDGQHRLVAWNNRYVEMYGLDPARVKRGTTLKEIVDFRYEAGRAAKMTAEKYHSWRSELATSSDPSHSVVELTNGQVIAIRHQPMPDGGWVATHEDVTEQKRAEQLLAQNAAALTRANEWFETLINNMPQGISLFDAEQRLVIANGRFREIYGYADRLLEAGTPAAALVADLVRRGIEPDMALDEIASLAQSRRQQSLAQVGERIVSIQRQKTLDGGWVASHEDVTEKFLAEQALAAAKADAVRSEQEARAAHQNLLDALDVVPEGIVIFDKDDRYLLWNKKYAEIFDRSGDLIVKGSRFEDVVRAGIARGQYPEANDEAWIQQRLALHAREQVQHEQQLVDGRWCRVEERRTANGSIGVRIDITDLKQRETMARMLFDQNPVLMWVFDPDTLKFLAVNDVVVDHYGYTREQFLNMTLLDIRPHEEREQARLAAMSPEEPWKHRSRAWRHIRADGSEIDVETYGKTFQYHGKAAVMVALIDVTDRKRAERRIEHIALHDALTDLPNRTALDQHFSRALARGEEIGERFAVLCIDLDRFKEINDLHGHSVGDLVLCEVSRRLRQACGAAFMARIGGDEFIAIMPEPNHDRDAIPRLVERLEAVLDSDVEAGGHCFELDLSIGIAMFPNDGTDATSLIANADAALYRAKQEGRGTSRYFTAAMDQQLRARRALERDLAGAVDRGELFLDYQPLARANGDIVGFEALARWRHPTRGLVQPGEFIPVAEESGLIIEIGEWVLREACREAASWPLPLRIAVNVSAIQFRRGQMQQMVHTILLETGLAPERLELEITEGVLIENVSRAAAMLRNLKSLGVRIALDDFGTGYSSLAYLQSFPLDRIKIDRSFIAKLERHGGSAAIVRSVIGLARGLRLPVLAEGVETEQQRQILAQEGCDEIQGYLIGRPTAIETYAEVVGRTPAIMRTANAG
jgi:diguanylate cyclase (GGDEF)-like protein/PAS domain S-box-containing protein